MSTTTAQLDDARVAALLARLDPRTDEPCPVEGCVHRDVLHTPIAA